MDAKVISIANERAAREKAAGELMSKVRTHVLLGWPLYGALMQRLKFRADWRCRTMYVDGRTLGYNPAFVTSNTFDELVFIVVHEVTHCAFGHPFRTRAKNKKLWNVACDHAVNLVLIRDPSLHMPSHGICDKQYTGLSADQIYAQLLADLQKKAQEEQAKEKQKKQQDEQQQRGGERQDDESGNDDSGAEQAVQGEGDDESDGKQQQSNEAAKPDPESEPFDVGSDLGDVIAPGDAGHDEDDDDDDNPFAQRGDTDDDEGDDDGVEQQEEQVQAGDERGDDDVPASDDDSGDDNGAGEPEGSTEGDEATDAELAKEWASAVSAAAIAQGDAMSEAFERLAREDQCRRQGFEEVLERFCVQRVRKYDDWSRPNRRYRDVYLPSQGGVGAASILFGIDTSGSVGENELGQMQDAMQRIAATANVRHSIVVYCDTRVRNVEEYEDEPPRFEKVKGGGGTRFDPLFQYAKERLDAGQDIAGIIYLTDQDGSLYATETYCDMLPTLWVNPRQTKTPPFGEACSMLD